MNSNTLRLYDVSRPSLVVDDEIFVAETIGALAKMIFNEEDQIEIIPLGCASWFGCNVTRYRLWDGTHSWFVSEAEIKKGKIFAIYE